MNKKTIRIIFDYPCFPVWIYDENHELIDTALPDEIADNAELKALCGDIRARYNALFTDNGTEFGYNGFGHEGERERFYRDVGRMTDIISESAGGLYNIEAAPPDL